MLICRQQSKHKQYKLPLLLLCALSLSSVSVRLGWLSFASKGKEWAKLSHRFEWFKVKRIRPWQ